MKYKADAVKYIPKEKQDTFRGSRDRDLPPPPRVYNSADPPRTYNSGDNRRRDYQADDRQRYYDLKARRGGSDRSFPDRPPNPRNQGNGKPLYDDRPYHATTSIDPRYRREQRPIDRADQQHFRRQEAFYDQGQGRPDRRPLPSSDQRYPDDQGYRSPNRGDQRYPQDRDQQSRVPPYDRKNDVRDNDQFPIRETKYYDRRDNSYRDDRDYRPYDRRDRDQQGPYHSPRAPYYGDDSRGNRQSNSKEYHNDKNYYGRNERRQSRDSEKSDRRNDRHRTDDDYYRENYRPLSGQLRPNSSLRKSAKRRQERSTDNYDSKPEKYKVQYVLRSNSTSKSSSLSPTSPVKGIRHSDNVNNFESKLKDIETRHEDRDHRKSSDFPDNKSLSNNSSMTIPSENESRKNADVRKPRLDDTGHSVKTDKTLRSERDKNGESYQKTKNKSSKSAKDHEKGYMFPEIEDIDVNDDDIEDEYKGDDVYVCYMMTDEGAVVGPLRLDIEDVQIGLPKPNKGDNNKEESDGAAVKSDDKEGMRNRQTGSHGLNETSSRSHAMMTLAIDSEQQDPDDENLYLTKRGKLTFVDLAGSEKVKDSHSTAETLIESNNINRSLLVLGNCISSLGDPKRRQGHIPYRDSKLTKLLADSLGGNGVTLMIACITPSSHHVSETMNTLRYASRAKRIRTKPLIKMDPREKLIVSLKREIKILRNENIYLRQQLEFPAKPKGALQKENDEKFMKFLKDQKTGKAVGAKTPQPNKQEEGGLYEMLQEYMIENEALRSENADLHATKDKIRREQQLLYRDNEKMMKRIEDLERLMGTTAWPRQQEQFYNPPVERQVSQSPRQSPAHFNGPPQWQQQGRHPSQEQFSNSSSPNGIGRGKGPPPPHGQPKRPPHRLPDTIARPAQIPPDMQNGVHNNGHHPVQNGPVRQESPARIGSRRASQISTTDSVRSMNEKLKQELIELEGEIAQHQIINQRTKSVFGSQTSVRSLPR